MCPKCLQSFNNHVQPNQKVTTADDKRNVLPGETPLQERVKCAMASGARAEVTAAAGFDIREQKPVPLRRSTLRRCGAAAER